MIETGVKSEVESYLYWLKIYHPKYEELTSGSFIKTFRIAGNEDAQDKVIFPSKLSCNQYYTVPDSKEYLLSSDGANSFITETDDSITISSDTWYVSNHLSSSHIYELRTGDLSLYTYAQDSGLGVFNRRLESANPHEGFEIEDNSTNQVKADLLNINSLAELKYQFLVTTDYKTYSPFLTLEYPVFHNIRVGTTILCKNQPTSLIDKEKNTSKFLKFFLADEDVYIPSKNSNGTYTFKKYEKGTKSYGLVTYLPLYKGNARWRLKDGLNNFSTTNGSWSVKSYIWNLATQQVSTCNIYNSDGTIRRRFAWTGEPIISELVTNDSDGYTEDFIANTTIEEVQSVIDNCNQWEYNINMKNENMRENLPCIVKIV